MISFMYIAITLTIFVIFFTGSKSSSTKGFKFPLIDSDTVIRLEKEVRSDPKIKRKYVG